MRAASIHETGGPEVLVLEELQRPQPDEGEVLIRVQAASVNPFDWKQRRGLAPTQLPAVLGSDVSGIVEISRAPQFAEEEEVFGFARSGAYAEFAVASAQSLTRKPASISHAQAAALPVAALTAWQAVFDRAALRTGQSALIAGAAGGVGHLAVQLAKYAGAHVSGIGSPRNRDFVLELGADEYVDYTRQDLETAVSGVDFAFDTVGGALTLPLLRTVREGGLLVTIAAAAPEPAAAERGVRAEPLVMHPDSEQLGRIAELVASGQLRVEIAETLPLEQVRRAHELSEGGHTRGKLVLLIGD